ncbi:MAG: hypothetical protein ACPG31_09335 [Planctomycetota bacterium]
MDNPQPVFPAYIRYSGEDGVTLVSGSEEWKIDMDLIMGDFCVEDQLIDSLGQVFRIEMETAGPKRGTNTLHATGVFMGTEDVRMHMMKALEEIRDRDLRLRVKAAIFQTEEIATVIKHCRFL